VTPTPVSLIAACVHDDLGDDIASNEAALYEGFVLWPTDISGQTTIPVCWLVPGSATEKA
jgi:hypothetical protein